MIVTAKGKAKGKELFLALDESGGGSIETVAPGGSAQEEGGSAGALTGEQKTIVMVANFQDKNVTCSNPLSPISCFPIRWGNRLTHCTGRPPMGMSVHRSGGWPVPDQLHEHRNV